MKANELRIGNLVKVDNPKYHSRLKNVALIVTSIDSNMYTENKNTHSIRLSHVKELKNQYQPTYAQLIKFIEPIPLTEEWLLKAGFSNDFPTTKNHKHYSLNGFNLSLFKYEPYYTFTGLRNYPIKINYIHQLQNLFFALTNEELTIK